MTNSISVTEERIAVAQHEVEIPDLELGSSKLGLGLILGMAGFVGFWGACCLVNGLGSCGSAAELGRSLLTAVSGL